MAQAKQNTIAGKVIVTLAAIGTAILLVKAGVDTAQSGDEWRLVNEALILILPVWLILMVRPTMSPFEPLNMLLFFFAWGVLWKIPYLYYNRDAFYRLLDGQPVSIFSDGLWLIALAVATFLIGYAIVSPGGRRPRKPVPIVWKRWQTLLLCVVTLAIGVIATLMVIKSLGISSLTSQLSQKRFLDLEGASGRLGTALYTYYKVALIARIPFLVGLVYLLSGNRWMRPLFAIIVVVSLFISLLVPIIFNTRGNAILTIIDLIAIVYLAGLRMKKRHMAVFGALCFGVFSYMTIARIGDRYTSAFDAIMGHRYFLELTRTAQILHYFSVNDLRLYGETLIGWIFVPVPASIMPNKPLFVDLGKFIGTNIFGYDVTGSPAGFVGELYINFGYPGVAIGMLLAGLVIGGFWRLYVRQPGNLFISTAVAMIVVRFGIFLFNNDFGTFMIKNLIETLPTVLVLYMVAFVPRRRRVVAEQDYPRPSGASFASA